MKSRRLVIFLLGMLLCLTIAAQQNTTPSNQAQAKAQSNKGKAANPVPDAKETSERLQKLTDSVAALNARVDKLTESQATTDLKAKVDALSGRLWTAILVTIVLSIALIAVLLILLPKLSNAATAAHQLTNQLQPLQNALPFLQTALNYRPTTARVQAELQPLQTALNDRPTLAQLQQELLPLQTALSNCPTIARLQAELQPLQIALNDRPTLAQLQAQLQQVLKALANQ